MDEEVLHLRATTSTTTTTVPDAAADVATPPNSRIKPAPQSAAISAPFSYSPSDDGTDENLLVLLHGLGSHNPLSFPPSPPPPFFFFFFSYLICTFISHRGHPRSLQQTWPFLQASPDGHAGFACTGAVRPHIRLFDTKNSSQCNHHCAPPPPHPSGLLMGTKDTVSV